MTQVPSPYSEPVITPRGSNGATQNTVIIVAIIAVTVLMICGGVLGLGIYAVDRLAEQFDELLIEDGDWEQGDSEFAVQYSIAEDPIILDRAGQIESIETHEDLTYHINADVDDYFYRIKGSKGEVTVVARFDYEDQRWFESVELLEGDRLRSARTPLQLRSAPFDSEWAMHAYEILAAEDHRLEKSLDIGAIVWMVYEYEESRERAKETELVFEITGETDTIRVVVQFESIKYMTVESIDTIDDEGNRQHSIYSKTIEVEPVD